MTNNFRYSLLLLSCLLAAATTVRAQVDSVLRRPDTATVSVDTSRSSVAIFVPLYLDSAFDAGGNYRYDKNFPKFFNPGLEFYEGAQMALDTLAKEGMKLAVQVYDTRNSKGLEQELGDAALQGVGLIIGQVSSPTELQLLAAAAAKKNIPFINVNYPNDGGVTNNSSLVILNSTLRTHCEGIYRYLQRNYPMKSLVFFRKNGAQEDRLKGYFLDIEKKTASVPLKIKYVTLDDHFDAAALELSMDSSQQTVCIAGSLDEVFGARLCTLLASLNRTYRSTVIGMPTWDNLDLSKPEFAGEEIAYSTPFYTNPTDTLVKVIQQHFKTRFYSRPTDMVFRGYESVYRFSKLLGLHGKDLSGSIGEKKFKVFNDFEITPIFLNRQNLTLDYFENKKLYFIKKMDGIVVAVN